MILDTQTHRHTDTDTDTDTVTVTATDTEKKRHTEIRWILHGASNPPVGKIHSILKSNVYTGSTSGPPGT